MLQSIVDRRLAGKNKSIGNREKFLKRYNNQIKKAVEKLIQKKGLKDALSEGGEVSIPKKDLQEPHFVFDKGGVRDYVHPGNKDYVQGDKIERPQGQGGSGSGEGEASPDGEGEDSFIFSLSKEEFLKYFFEDMELPNMVKKVLMETPDFKTKRAGYVSSGAPNNLHIVRSMRTSLARRIALKPSQEDIAKLREELKVQHPFMSTEDFEELLKMEVKKLTKKIPFLDPIDLKYRDSIKVPNPSTNAVMICLMDTSGSMDEERKNLAKRFFVLLHLFLTKHYEKIEVVFVKHTTNAQEVDEHTFFYSPESGGTMVSSGLNMVGDIIKRYNPDQWNIYVAQASDGDNWDNDTPTCTKVLNEKIIPFVQYFAYIQVVAHEQSLWKAYQEISGQNPDSFVAKKAVSVSDIYPVFRELFEKKVTN